MLDITGWILFYPFILSKKGGNQKKKKRGKPQTDKGERKKNRKNQLKE